MSEGRERPAPPESQRASSEEARPDIAERVLQYFRDNPTAMDSVEGIARFWVHEERGVVESCLLDLHRRGLLDKRTIAGIDLYSPVSGEPAVGKRPPGRILVVDDDPSVREFLVDALTHAGHSVAAADGGGRAIEVFRAGEFDLVITDIVMPGVSGIEVLQAVKGHAAATDVLVITAFPDLEIALEALRKGAHDLITKPITDLEAFYRMVERALEKRRLTDENRRLVQNLEGRNRELTETVARLAAVNEIGAATTGLLDLKEIYGALVRLVAQHLKARRVSLLTIEPDSDVMKLAASVGIGEAEARNLKLRVGEGIAGRVAATQAPLLVPDIDRTDFKQMKTGAHYATGSFMITPLMLSYPIRYQRRRVGIINVTDKHTGDSFDDRDLEFLSTLASQVAVAIENARLVKEMEGGYLGALVGLIQAAEEARPETRGHSRRVAELAAAVARAMGLEEPQVEILFQAAALHEVGRQSSGPEVNGRKRGRGEPAPAWSPEAAVAAERVLAPIASLREAREIILHSAGRFDAAPGFPLAEPPGIPVESWILAACDEYVHLTHAGLEDPARASKAIESIRQGAGKKHDPEVVVVLARVVEGRETR